MESPDLNTPDFKKSPKPPENPSIIRIDGQEDRLKAKLEEYKKRKDEFRAPELQWDVVYKMAVTEELLEHGEVDMYDLRSKLLKKYGDIDDKFFRNAFDVIRDYVTTGGSNTRKVSS